MSTEDLERALGGLDAARRAGWARAYEAEANVDALRSELLAMSQVAFDFVVYALEVYRIARDAGAGPDCFQWARIDERLADLFDSYATASIEERRAGRGLNDIAVKVFDIVRPTNGTPHSR